MEENQVTLRFPREDGPSPEPKAFAHARRFTPDGSAPTDCFTEADSLLVQGENLACLSSLLPRYRGQMKLIYIDPPYNTGSGAFGYKDRFPRGDWLRFMERRLVLARELLREDGAIYVQLDYHQVHYAKVLMDEIFGEENFQREIIWRIGWLSGYKTRERNWIRNHDSILFYSKNAARLDFRKQYLSRTDFKKIARSNAERYPIEDVWNASEYDDLNSIAIVSFAGETVSKLLDPADEVKGQKSEKLIQRIILAHTDPGDLVLDFFGGSGTTAAVCMKTGRRFILCEKLEKHVDITRRRLEKVMAGEQSGVSKVNGWKGGGSFISCELTEEGECGEADRKFTQSLRQGRGVSVSQWDTSCEPTEPKARPLPQTPQGVLVASGDRPAPTEPKARP